MKQGIIFLKQQHYWYSGPIILNNNKTPFKILLCRLIYIFIFKLYTVEWLFYEITEEVYHLFIFCKNKIITTESNTKDDRSHTFKAMNPFLPFGSLSTHIEHPEKRHICRDLPKLMGSMHNEYKFMKICCHKKHIPFLINYFYKVKQNYNIIMLIKTSFKS